MSVTDLLALQEAKRNESRSIIDKAEAEKRKLTKTEEEILTRNGLEMQRRALDILEKDAENRQTVAEQEAAPRKGKISLRKMIVEAIQGSFSDESKEVIKRGRSLLSESGVKASNVGNVIDLPLETRTAQTVGVAANGGNTVETERQGILLPLMDNIVLDALGVSKASGLTGDVVFPSVSAIEANWAGETTASTETNAVFKDDIVFKPKRLTAKVKISNQLLIQSSEDVEMILRNMIVEAVQQKLQATIFGSAAATSTKPGGLFNGTIANSGDITWDRVIGLRTELAKKNALLGTPKFLINPELSGICRTKLKSTTAGSRYLIDDDNKLGGFDVVETNAIPTGLQTGADESAIAFGNWADYFIGSWGAIRLTVDTTTLADQDSVQLIINSYWDAGKLREESIVTATAK